MDDYVPSEDDEDGMGDEGLLDAATVRELHFGGGLVAKDGDEQDDRQHRYCACGRRNPATWVETGRSREPEWQKRESGQ